jgi:hypothetical protein
MCLVLMNSSTRLFNALHTSVTFLSQERLTCLFSSLHTSVIFGVKKVESSMRHQSLSFYHCLRSSLFCELSACSRITCKANLSIDPPGKTPGLGLTSIRFKLGQFIKTRISGTNHELVLQLLPDTYPLLLCRIVPISPYSQCCGVCLIELTKASQLPYAHSLVQFGRSERADQHRTLGAFRTGEPHSQPKDVICN